MLNIYKFCYLFYLKLRLLFNIFLYLYTICKQNSLTEMRKMDKYEKIEEKLTKELAPKFIELADFKGEQEGEIVNVLNGDNSGSRIDYERKTPYTKLSLNLLEKGCELDYLRRLTNNNEDLLEHSDLIKTIKKIVENEGWEYIHEPVIEAKSFWISFRGSFKEDNLNYAADLVRTIDKAISYYFNENGGKEK